MLSIEMPRSRMRLHAGIHYGLRITRLVAFVVTQPAKSDEIENDILVEFPAIVERYLHHAARCLGRVAIDMKDRRLRDLRGVRRIDRAAAKFGRCGETDLVVDDDVNGA